MDDLTAAIQRSADEDHARQPHCSWCGRAGEPYEHRGVRFDGLTACRGDRLCAACRDLYLKNTPLLVAEVKVTGAVESVRVYDVNRNTAAWSEENIPGCGGEPPVRAIAVAYRPEYADYKPAPRRRRNRA